MNTYRESEVREKSESRKNYRQSVEKSIIPSVKCRGDHDFHICILMQRGNNALVESMTQSPQVKCGICGIIADDADCVCKPVVLKK